MCLKPSADAVCLVVAVAMFLGASTAQGIPSLQLYLEGGTYDSETESWVLVPPGPSGGDLFRLWTVGNIDGAGGHGSIENVRLSVAYDAVAVAPLITLTPSTTGGFGGWTDLLQTGDPTWIQTVTDGSSPILGDGSSLPSHGIFGPGTYWQEFGLGDFTETGDSIGNIIDELPLGPLGTGGQINVYEISVLNSAGLTLHFDLYNTLMATNHASFAPFSHDAEIVPDPGSAVLIMAGLGLVAFMKRRLL